jgi:tRNA threonylcarbamoyladenosine biosynthesis protein TsaB
VRILALETSSRRGSVALLDGELLVASLEHEQPNSHAERLLPLIERLLSEAGWAKTSLDRLGVGVGPGSFTGLRVGIALAEGLSVGLDRPVIGVGSLRAMAFGALTEHAGPCCALLDARREELFAAVYAADGRELCAPSAIPVRELRGFLRAQGVTSVVGEVAQGFAHACEHVTGPLLDLPHARWVGALARVLDEAQFPPEPQYVRGIGAALPDLPRSSLNPQ